MNARLNLLRHPGAAIKKVTYALFANVKTELSFRHLPEKREKGYQVGFAAAICADENIKGSQLKV
jgi:hypothetical protein